jgi:hypothetical protein
LESSGLSLPASGRVEMSGRELISLFIRELLAEREIIARCELLYRIYDHVRKAELDPLETEELQKLVGRPIAPGIFASIMGKDPVFFDLPRLDSFTMQGGRIFHFSHDKKYSKADFERAYMQFISSIPELRILLRASLVDLLKEIMFEAGYQLSTEKGGEIEFRAANRRARAFVYGSIKSIDLKRRATAEEDCILLVPSGESLEPFIEFFKAEGERAMERGVQIWVANMERGTIDPFVGYTTDMDIYRQFKNPRLAEMVRTHWRAC